MRLNDVATSAENAFSDGAAFVSRTMSPAARRLAWRFADAAGSIELASVLAGENGRVTCRFRARFRGNVPPRLGLWRLSGRRAPFSAERVSRIASVDGVFEAVFSVSVPRRTVGFLIGGSEVGLLSVDRHDLCRLERSRDGMMVNPGIDGRYRHALAPAAPPVAPCASGASSVDAPADEASSGTERAGSAPLMSIIVPLYNTPIGYFRAMAGSVLGQTYGNWELVLVNASPENAELAHAVDDVVREGGPRVVVVELDENRGISENTVAGIEMASGDYLSFLDHDDLLAPDALAAYVREISEHPDTDLLYCDEDSVTHDGSVCFEARFKPDFNYDLLLTHNYVCHFLTVSREAYEKVEPYARDVDGAQDYDLTLKVSEVARGIRRVPRVLYHWRQHAGSTNGGATQAKPYVVKSSINVITRHLARRGIDAVVTPTDYPCVFDVAYPKSEAPDVTVVAAYRTDEELAGFLASLEGQCLRSVRQLVEAGPSNDFGSLVNEAAAQAEGDYLLVSDARVRFVPDADCIGVLRDVFCREEVGIASAKVLAQDGHVLHAGLCVKDDGSVGYLNQGFTNHMGGGYHGFAECDCAYSAVGPFCFMVRTGDFRRVGGMSGGYASAVAQTVDFSFKVRALGKSVIVRPAALVRALMDPDESELGKSHVRTGSPDHEKLWRSHARGYRRDVLQNPNVDFSASYPNLRRTPCC